VRCLKLPFCFAPDQLTADLAKVAPAEWIPHVNRSHYDGHWSGAALRSIGGVATNIVPDAPDISAFRDTDLLSRCTYFQEVLGTFRCPLQAARLLRLHAGSSIAEHVDHALDFDEGEVRIHVPIVTNEGVQFFLDGARLVMAPGECWYTNVNLPHSVVNQSRIDRIHLVLDCQVNDWLREIFAATARPPTDHYAASMSFPTAPDPAKMMSTLAEFAAATEARFRVDQATLIAQWKGDHSWQIRMRPAASNPREFQIETSPDVERRWGAEVETFVAALTRAFPGVEIVRRGIS
jgi:hypothetical protein